MTTFWIVTGVVVALLLVGAWLFDRKWGFNRENLPSDARRASAEADAWRTQQGSTYGDSF
jgi:hypothetical protein